LRQPLADPLASGRLFSFGANCFLSIKRNNEILFYDKFPASMDACPKIEFGSRRPVPSGNACCIKPPLWLTDGVIERLGEAG